MKVGCDESRGAEVAELRPKAINYVSRDLPRRNHIACTWWDIYSSASHRGARSEQRLGVSNNAEEEGPFAVQTSPPVKLLVVISALSATSATLRLQTRDEQAASDHPRHCRVKILTCLYSVHLRLQCRLYHGITSALHEPYV